MAVKPIHAATSLYDDIVVMLDFCHIGGMSGLLLVASDEPCPSVLTAPYKLGDDITANGVVCANFK